MYESFYGLARRPFLPGPTPQTYFAAFAIESAYETLLRCLGRGEGTGVVIGPPGTGKTLLCLRLAETLKRQLQVAMPDCGRVSDTKTLLQAILFEIGRPYRGMDEGELRLSLVDHLSCDGRCPGGLLLIIDEAQSLPYRLLDELRLLTNIVRQGEPRVRLLLAGSPTLEERLAHPKLEQFSQRIAARCYLEAFNREETEQYVRAQLTLCGGDGEGVFTEDALEAIYRATDGIPRMINQLCDHALVLGFAGEQKPIGPQGIEEAWADLQQLPTPWNAQGSPCGSGTGAEEVIEFGALDESDANPSETSAAHDTPEQTSFDRADAADSEVPAPSEATIEIGALEGIGSDTGNIEQQVEQIEQYVDALNHEFEPGHVDDSEVQLSCVEPATDDEAIFEEELVIDRYRELEELDLVRHRSVRCAEGQDLAAMLELIEVSSSQTLRLADTLPEPAESPRAGSEATRNSEPSQIAEQSHSDQSDQPLDIAAAPPAVETLATASTQSWSRPTEPEEQEAFEHGSHDEVHGLGQSQTEADVDEDRDLIVIDDAGGSSFDIRPSRVRRREYRLLFRQLRSG